MHTKATARTKRCPHNIHGLVDQNSNCIVDDCMAWRWVTILTYSDGSRIMSTADSEEAAISHGRNVVKHDPDMKEYDVGGYCGQSGLPNNR